MTLAIQTPAQVDARMREEQTQRIEAQNQPREVVNNLAAHVRAMWSIAKTDKLRVQDRLMDCLRRRRGEYSSEKLAQIKKAGGAEVFMQITGSKCRAAKAWLADIFTSSGDRPWTLSPTPYPELPPQLKMQLVSTAVQQAMQLGVPQEMAIQIVTQHKERLQDELRQKATDAAEKMAVRIEDELVEGGFRPAFDEFLDDLVTYPAAIIRAPVYRKRRGLVWAQNMGNTWQPIAGDKLVRECYRVSPFDAFPSPASSEVDDDWFIERHRLTRRDLNAMRGVQGYNEQGIVDALKAYGLGGLREWLWSDGERDRLEGRGSMHTQQDTDIIDAIEWSGFLPGHLLLDWGMTPEEIPDPYQDYPISAMICGNYVLRAMVNPDPTGKSDYFKACWAGVPNSFWGSALPEILADCQDVCNAAARSLVNNMAMSSGPQVYYDADRIPKGTDVSSVFPWKIWATSSSKTGSSQPGIGFFQPASNSAELMNIYERFGRYADDIVGLPAFAFGSDQGAGAARTASGMSMLMGNASKAVKAVVRAVDIGVVEPLVRKYFTHLMLMDEDQEIKADLTIKARGSDSLIQKEVSQRRQLEFLAMTNNPIDMQIVGMEGRRELLHEAAKTLDVPADRIVPDAKGMQERQMLMMAQMQAQQAMGMKQPNGTPSPTGESAESPKAAPNPAMVEPTA
ncbi:hypothetical protein KUW19_00810 [Ferrimonas balearica]|uniref:portal protein n=1 Tax=Ferrimonas balearica TaxID=44012 RepID=UPI001C987CEA|nr:hypothetical protein [Ferrimonas balearica]MBY6105017.1 hypothetical protein [Ferrimonas balearica]